MFDTIVSKETEKRTLPDDFLSSGRNVFPGSWELGTGWEADVYQQHTFMSAASSHSDKTCVTLDFVLVYVLLVMMTNFGVQ